MAVDGAVGRDGFAGSLDVACAELSGCRDIELRMSMMLCRRIGWLEVFDADILLQKKSYACQWPQRRVPFNLHTQDTRIGSGKAGSVKVIKSVEQGW